ncbi:hypothetical protein LA66_06780 [Aureimonas altamirensis]|uniref:Uncharacterized protein n=2 Tax=Aureimonas altamirensis TaxID=370622 RepID=A0A0B1Q787_9HYPH|nr:hypothetical protein LA66_06780 [Aureimonas altamirensis]
MRALTQPHNSRKTAMKLAITLASLLLATPALATDKPGGDTYNQTWDNSQNVFQRIDNFLTQRQQQVQGQAQGQGQSQTATGGSANNSNSVNVDNRTRVTNAPTVIGNGETYGVSGAVAGVALGGVVPSRAAGRGKIGRNIIELSGDRAALYTQCGLPHTHKTLMLKGIRCDLDGAQLIAWEAQFQPKRVVTRKPAPARHARRSDKRCGC